MMPDDLMNSVTKQQLMDVVEFLTTLKTSTHRRTWHKLRAGGPATVQNGNCLPKILVGCRTINYF